MFCYDLMNEPVVPGGRRKPGDWLGPPFGEFHYVQFITLDQKGRPRPEIARAWVETLVKAIRRVDPPPSDHGRHGRLEPGPAGLDVGLRPRDGRPGARFPLRPPLSEGREGRRGDRDARGLRAAGKPVVIEETFPLMCGAEEFRDIPRAIEEARRGLGRVLLGQDARGAQAVEDHLRRHDAGMAGDLPCRTAVGRT